MLKLCESSEANTFKLDDRYFCGLKGQYSFKLSFRLHKSGEEEYIVRSHGNYCMRRSVTAELELEPGEYHVLVKIEAQKYDSLKPVENILRKNAKVRRNKLLRIGRAYDLAHAKGEIIESSEEKAGREELEAKEKAKKRKEMKDKIMTAKKRRKHVENKEARKTRETIAKHRAKAKAMEARRKAKEAKKAEQGTENEQNDKEIGSQDTKNEQKDKETGTEKKEDVKIEAEKAKDGEDSAVKPSPSEIPPPSETKSEDNPAGDSATGERSAPKDTEKASLDEEAQGTNPSTDKEGEKAKSIIETTRPVEGETDLSDDDDEDDDDDDQSDIDSVVSDVSSGVVDEAIAEQEAADKLVPAAVEGEKDEFEKHPWNAVAIVGLRVYSKGSPVSIRVIRPKFWEGEDKESIATSEKDENMLDVDDSAVDAATGGTEAEKVASDEARKTDGGSEKSEGSVVVV